MELVFFDELDVFERSFDELDLFDDNSFDEDDFLVKLDIFDELDAFENLLDELDFFDDDSFNEDGFFDDCFIENVDSPSTVLLLNEDFTRLLEESRLSELCFV